VGKDYSRGINSSSGHLVIATSIDRTLSLADIAPAFRNVVVDILWLAAGFVEFKS